MGRMKQRRVVATEPATFTDPHGTMRHGHRVTLACGHSYVAYVALKTTTCPQCDDGRGERIEAEQKAAMWLHRANVAAERGEHEKAERHYERSQKWHDRMIELAGES